MKIVILSLMLTLLMGSLGFAGDDRGIPVSEKDKIKATMVDYIKDNSTRQGNFLLLDPETKTTRALRYDRIHQGVVKHNDGFLTCVDMIDGGIIVDVDFIVSMADGEYRVSKIAIHKVDRVKRKGHLKH